MDIWKTVIYPPESSKRGITDQHSQIGTGLSNLELEIALPPHRSLFNR